MTDKIDGLVLFSGGLDSLLAAHLLKKQNLNILCLHFFSPFFGKPDTSHWEALYSLNIRPVDISGEFIEMLLDWPENGPGKTLNPCVDCKILMLKKARAILAQTGAKFIATGEVIGQRPMSQRIESLNIIKKRTELADLLLRPLSAPLLPETLAEKTGLVDRNLLPRISGRGRNAQLSLAREAGIVEIPSPGGGCKLTEKENARRYWPLIQKYMARDGRPPLNAIVNDFQLTHAGRILFQTSGSAWLCIGRNKENNEQINALTRSKDIILQLPFPGPVGLLRNSDHDSATIRHAAAIVLAHSPRAKAAQKPVQVKVKDSGGISTLLCEPAKFEDWTLPAWEDVHAAIKLERKRRMAL